MNSTTSVHRPYRSHKIRACDYCRRRKQRCSIRVLGQSCDLCKNHGITCSYQSTTANEDRKSTRKRSFRSLENEQEVIALHATHKSHSRDVVDTSPHVVGPIASKDAQVLEQFMSPTSDGQRVTENPYHIYSADPRTPILFTQVERSRVGFIKPPEPGIKQKEIIEHVLGNYLEPLLDIYLKKVHPSFPMVEEKVIIDYKTATDRNSSSTLMCYIYATTLCFWHYLEDSLKHPRPDQRFAWNQAVKALQGDFLAPSLTTLQAAMVDLTGRPIYSLKGNVINTGRCVALANSLGLNRNPKGWNISGDEKSLRVRLWWGVFIHDTWGSLAHGTPPNINPNYHDVVIPDLESLLSPNGRYTDRQCSECFLAFCRLTEILAKVLPLVYCLHDTSTKEVRKVFRVVEEDLDQWEESLPEALKDSSLAEIPVSGSRSLKLCYLSLKMLIYRVLLHTNQSNTEDQSTEALAYHQAECRKAALAIVNFIGSLNSTHLKEFWIPYSAYYMTSATMMLLRIAVETIEDEISTTCVSSVKDFTRFLREMRDTYDWDLGDHCLRQCEGIIARMNRNARIVERRSSQDAESLLMSFDIDGSFDWLDSSLPTSFGLLDDGQGRNIWDMFDDNQEGQDLYN